MISTVYYGLPETLNVLSYHCSSNSFFQDSWASYDFVAGDYDPTPTKYSGDEPDSHGTSCAGEVGMVKDNNNCGVGVAYQCKIGGLKIDLGETHDVSESSALSYKENHVDVYSNSWGPSDSGYVVSGPGHYLAKTFENGVITVSIL